MQTRRRRGAAVHRRLPLALLVVLISLVAGADSAAALSWRDPVRLVDQTPPAQFDGKLVALSCYTVYNCIALTSGGSAARSTSVVTDPEKWPLTAIDPGGSPTAISCRGSHLCVEVDNGGNAVATGDVSIGLKGWTRAPIDDGRPLTGVACPTFSLCVAVDAAGNVVTSTNPTGGASAWSVTPVDTLGLTGVSCTSTPLCVAVDEGGAVVTSTNPTGGAAAWTRTRVEKARGLIRINAVDCPSSSLCVAVDAAGNVLSSTNPTGGASAWKVVDIGSALLSVSCANPTLCVAGDGQGFVRVAESPTSSASAWTGIEIGSGDVGAVSCAESTTQVSCVATNGYKVVESTSPQGGAAAWHAHPVGFAPLTDVACASSLCVTAGRGGTVLATSTNPGGGASAWNVGAAAGAYRLTCPSTALCLVAAGNDLKRSTNPASGPGSFAPIGLEPSERIWQDVSCASLSLCVAVGGKLHTGAVAVSTQPAAGPRSWSVADLPGMQGMVAVACASPTFCAAVDGFSGFASSSNPSGGPGTWRVQTLPVDGLAAVSCPSSSRCFAVAGGSVLSGDPSAVSPTFSAAEIDPDYRLTGIACPLASLCTAVDKAGRALASSNPTAGAGAWTSKLIDSRGGLTSIECRSPYFCAATDYVGQVLVTTGPTPQAAPPPGALVAMQVASALKAALKASCRKLRIGRLLARGGCATPFRAPIPGSVSLRWTAARPAAAAKRRRATVIAAGTRAFTRARRAKVRARLTNTGRRVLAATKARRRLRLELTATFKAAGRPRQARTLVVTLRR